MLRLKQRVCICVALNLDDLKRHHFLPLNWNDGIVLKEDDEFTEVSTANNYYYYYHIVICISGEIVIVAFHTAIFLLNKIKLFNILTWVQVVTHFYELLFVTEGKVCM